MASYNAKKEALTVKLPRDRARTDNDEAIGAEIAKAKEYAQKLLDTAIGVAGAAHVELTPQFARDPKVVAVAILCRAISNFRASILLVAHENTLEARVIVRLIYENLLWLSALRERGHAFVEDMLNDEAFNRTALSQLTLRLTAKHGADVNQPDALVLRSIINEMEKKFPGKKKLHANSTAALGVTELAYIEYQRLSLDAVHCSLTALGRHLSTERSENRTELEVSVVPRTPSIEALSTILHACFALTGVAVGTNEMLGFTPKSDELMTRANEFDENGWRARLWPRQSS
jgi:hypothetical protein